MSPAENTERIGDEPVGHTDWRHSGAYRNIAVVGAGAAGTLTAMRLLHNSPEQGDHCRVWLIDPGTTGRGLAFATDASHHLLNVPAAGMSAHRDDPDHFVRWLAHRGTGQDFVTRGLYGRYLAESLEAASERCGTTHLVRTHDRVVGISHRPERAGSSLCLQLGAGRTLDVDAAVLALGNFPPDQSWAPPSLRTSPRFFTDPWAPGALASVPDDRDILLVGTGLTMVDAALTLKRPGRVVHAVSRNGLVPQPHAESPASPLTMPTVPCLDARSGLTALRRAVLRHIAGCRRMYGDWRPGMDSLRPVTVTLWLQLPPPDRARFLSQHLRLWETHRHRIPPVSARALETAMGAGLVVIGKGTVADARPAADHLHIRLDDGRCLQVGAVVNCTGSQTDLTRVDDPLVASLLASGLGRPAAIGGGFDTAPTGQLRPASHGVPAPLWTLGSLRRGNLLETTAVPEIRCQADDLARTLLQR
ncbi:FAD/NAD(P)-binding protein [Streptomyces sp. RB6PN25]|uniref:FAD/NAD(P)-binding protein n=1 Tax=Streptomyces humicola TaxID=2953240 RepID=A0ABT1PR68_9ACTN|nr:FAD/NAD(P)-binding protein [Streptomyces humicola]MCQ4079057.1 FAD/NAD(P)-binding protein [Streptomyces humicola]